MRSVTTAARAAVERQKTRDRDFEGYQGALLARMAAVIAAQKAAGAGELGAHAALRQSLVELAAISELLAEDLPSHSDQR
jgi:hypothetical protein